MRIYLFLLFILMTFTSSFFALPKYDSQLSMRNDRPSYPIKRKVPKYKASYTPSYEELSEIEKARILKEKIMGNNNYDKQKRSFKYGNYGRRYDRLIKRDLRPQVFRDDPYGVVYDNGRPVGILEPYPQAYEFSPWSKAGNLVRNQRYADDYYPMGKLADNSQMDEQPNEEEVDDSPQFGDDANPMLYNDLKVDSNYYNKRNNLAKIQDGDYQSEDKRNANKDETSFQDNQESKLQNDKTANSGITDEQVEELKTTLSRIKNPGPLDSVEEIERSLRSILSDMGLVSELENNKNKREANTLESKEDENLEDGANKIDLIKSDSAKVTAAERSKREDNTPSEGPSLKAGTFLSNSGQKDPAIVKVANYQKEGEAFIRSKRQEAKAEDIMKGLEKSGDLTVSGNKSPLASSETDDQITSKTTSHPDKLNKRELEYQKNVEKIIQAKIDAIKEQVKREIAEMNSADVSTAKNVERRKRDVSSSLLDEESEEVDPQKHPDAKLTPHIRAKRNTEELVPLKRVKRSLLDFSNLNKIDSGDYLELAGEKQEHQHVDSDYQVDPQENKYLPENLRMTSKNHKYEELLSLDDENLNNNLQDGLSEHSSKIKERSISAQLELESKVKLKEQDFAKGEGNSKFVEKQPDEMLAGKSQSEPTPFAESNSQSLGKENAGKFKEKRDDVKLERKSIEEEVGARKENDNVKIEEQANEEKKLVSPSDENISNAYKSVSIEQNVAPTEQQANSKDSIKLEKKSVDGSSENGANTDQAAPVEMKSLPSELELDKKVEKRAADQSQSIKSETKNVQVQKKDVTTPKLEIFDEEIKKRKVDDDIPLMRRRKRENELSYRPDDMELDEEDDEFDDDSFDDRTMLKRDVDNSLGNFADSKEAGDYQNEYEDPEEFKPQKRSALQNRQDNLDSDLFEGQSNNFLYQPQSDNAYVRRKRHSLADMRNFHGGAAMLRHIAAIKERNAQNEVKVRNKRSEEENSSNEEDLNDLDLFGGLPQSYNGGELSRFKRVKRNDNGASFTHKS